MTDRDDVTRSLAELGERRQAAIDERRRVSDEIAAALPRAHAAGLGVTEIARLTGLSRQAVYDLLGET